MAIASTSIRQLCCITKKWDHSLKNVEPEIKIKDPIRPRPPTLHRRVASLLLCCSPSSGTPDHLRWLCEYEKKLAENKDLDALIEVTLADAPPPLSKTPPWLMKLGRCLLFIRFPESQQMLGLLHQNLREWREIARLDSSYENYREIAAGVLLMYGGKSDSKAINLAMERLAAILPRSETKEFPKLDHFGIERTAPREVAKAVGDYFLKK